MLLVTGRDEDQGCEPHMLRIENGKLFSRKLLILNTTCSIVSRDLVTSYLVTFQDRVGMDSSGSGLLFGWN